MEDHDLPLRGDVLRGGGAIEGPDPLSPLRTVCIRQASVNRVLKRSAREHGHCTIFSKCASAGNFIQRRRCDGASEILLPASLLRVKITATVPRYRLSHLLRGRPAIESDPAIECTLKVRRAGRSPETESDYFDDGASGDTSIRLSHGSG